MYDFKYLFLFIPLLFYSFERASVLNDLVDFTYRHITKLQFMKLNVHKFVNPVLMINTDHWMRLIVKLFTYWLDCQLGCVVEVEEGLHIFRSINDGNKTFIKFRQLFFCPRFCLIVFWVFGQWRYVNGHVWLL